MLIKLFNLSLIFIHYLRWLAIIQQKEYRLDRYLLFLKTKEGIRDLFLPFPFSLKRLPDKSDLKRPKLTSKILTIIFITASIIIFSYYKSVLKNHINIYLFFIFAYLKAPTTIFIASLPATLFTQIITIIEIKKAIHKLEKTKPIIIGITGSYGKSSTKFLTKHLLSQKYKVFCTPKSYNKIFSVAHSINQSYKNESIVILEYGAYKKNEIKKLAQYFKPSHAILTGITNQHLGLFKSLENIKKAKSELIKALPKNGLIFYNGKNSHICQMVNNTNLKKIDFTKINFRNIVLDDFQLNINFNKKTIKTKLIGTHYLNNIKAAVATSHYFNLSNQEIIQALKTFKPNNVFIKIKKTKSKAIIINDSKSSNPQGFKKAIDILKSSKQKNKILLTSGIIDLGKKSSQIHLSLAKKSKKVFNKVLYTENYGKKEFKQIFKNRLISDKLQIIKQLSNLDNNTILLIEGKIKSDILKYIY